MRLSTRLSLFFLTTLALVLAGFSVSLYLLASKHLYRQADERLEAALNTLAAAAELSDNGAEWEPEERRVSFGRRILEGSLVWMVQDDRGRKLDGSPAGDLDRLFAESGPPTHPSERPTRLTDRSGHVWRIMRRRLEAPSVSQAKPESGDDPPESGERHAALVISAAVSLDGVRATLFHGALVLVGLAIGLWTLALLFGRRLSQRALRPLTAMADAAHTIGGDDLHQRLPVPATGDELEELGRSFNALLNRLQESFERQRRFTGDASHQLRTPLTAMQGQVDLALRQERSAEEYQRVLMLLQRRTRHLRQIVEALLFLARGDAESLRPNLEPIDVAAWLEGHLRSRSESEPAAGVRLTIDTNGPIWVRSQPALLGELVNNLLDNAIKYSAPGSPIDVRVGQNGDRVILSVEDRGLGIAPEELPHIFEPFYRSSVARGRGINGVGLGLAVAQRLARSLGGIIEAESRVGVGSRFVVRLPAATDPPSLTVQPTGLLGGVPLADRGAGREGTFQTGQLLGPERDLQGRHVLNEMGPSFCPRDRDDLLTSG
jgi:two-component system OmpR family sensor kinase